MIIYCLVHTKQCMYSELGDEDETISADEDNMGRRYISSINYIRMIYNKCRLQDTTSLLCTSESSDGSSGLSDTSER